MTGTIEVSKNIYLPSWGKWRNQKTYQSLGHEMSMFLFFQVAFGPNHSKRVTQGIVQQDRTAMKWSF